jgi:hypothetical protein
MKKRWPEFLFNVGVRALCGLIIGFLAGLLLNWEFNLHEASHDHTRRVLVWLLACTMGGALVAILSVPHWQRPWYKGIRDPDDGRAAHIDDTYTPVAPQAYNRLTNPSPKHLHDFLAWLRETTVAELGATRGDSKATKTVFVRFFQRGLRAEVLLAELTDILPSIVTRAAYPESERSQVIAMLKGLTLEELGIKLNAEGRKVERHADAD